MIAGLAIIIINLLVSLRNKTVAVQNPWGGATLEWSIPSPPPVENFDEIPVITKNVYHYE